MISILGKIPKCHFHVACSGGSDSMVLVDFLLRYPKNSFDILHFNHGTEYCDEAEEFVREFCKSKNIDLYVSRISSPVPKGESRENFWRANRYKFISKYSSCPILLAHHLNDCIETWIMTSLKGNPQIIPYRNEKYNIIRPMLITNKNEINSWIERHNISYIYDKSNDDISITRNYVRHNMMKSIYDISPGIEKIIKKKILDNYRSTFNP